VKAVARNPRAIAKAMADPAPAAGGESDGFEFTGFWAEPQ
jgi:hypothetical protein